MAELHFFPMYAAEWLAGQATTLMTLEQEAAFLRLLLHSWLSAGVPCSVPNDDAALATLSKMGKRWAKEGAFVRAQFEEIEEYPGNLRNPKLWAVYVEQMEKHSKRVIAGALGGTAAQAKRKQKPSIAQALLKQKGSNATAMLKQKSSTPAIAKGYQSESESELDTETAKTTTSDSGESGRKTWPVLAADLWSDKVTPVAPGFCGKFLKPAVDRFGFPAVLAGLEKYIVGTPDWKTRRLDDFAKEANKWVRFGGMKTNDEKGALTEWGQYLDETFRPRKSA